MDEDKMDLDDHTTAEQDEYNDTHDVEQILSSKKLQVASC
jgi:hypothetical protein